MNHSLSLNDVNLRVVGKFRVDPGSRPGRHGTLDYPFLDRNYLIAGLITLGYISNGLYIRKGRSNQYYIYEKIGFF